MQTLSRIAGNCRKGLGCHVCRTKLARFFFFEARISGTKKEPKPKLLSPDIFWWGGGLPREGVGAKKFGMSLETQGIKLFWRDIPGFRRDIPEAPEKFEKKMFGFNSRPLESSHEKCSENFPEILEPLFCEFKEKPAKLPPNFPPKNQKKKFTDELLQDCREEKEFHQAPTTMLFEKYH